jgi:signal transduction histidine kinase/CheY-like chemotaxis protein
MVSQSETQVLIPPVGSIRGRSLFVLAAVGCVCVVRALMGVYADTRAPYVLFLAAVAASAHFAGWRAGIAAMLLGLLAGSFFFAEPSFNLEIETPQDLYAALSYLLASGVIIAVVAAEARSRKQLALRDLQLQREHEERLRLQTELESSRRLEAIGKLAGGVAHDFNNLLTVVLGSATLLRGKVSADALIDDIELAAQRGASLTQQLLGFARRQMLVMDVMSLNDVVDESLRLLRRLVPEDIRITTVFEPEPWLVLADRAQLQQLIMNLVVNARDALPSGGSVNICTRNTTLSERFAARHPEVTPGEYVQLSVTDDGVGMSDELQRHVFEPFFTTKPVGQGTGLGLAMAYGLVKQLNGHISLRSRPQRGSRFDIYLPRAVRVVQPTAATIEQSVPSMPRLTVLLVDDNEQVRVVTARMLSQLGHDVLSAENGAEALETARAHRGPIDVLLADVVMPWMNGSELAKRLRALHPDLAVLFITGYPENDVLTRNVVQPGTELLTKPFSSADLDAALRKVARRHAAAG